MRNFLFCLLTPWSKAYPAKNVGQKRFLTKVKKIKAQPFASASSPRISIRKSSGVSYDDAAWKPVANPDIYNHDDDDDDTNDIQDEIISESNYWKKIPRFSTSSNYKKKTFHWRSYPILTNRRSDGNQGKIKGLYLWAEFCGVWGFETYPSIHWIYYIYSQWIKK